MISLKDILSIANIPFILALGAVLLFFAGYVSHMVLGAHNAVEEISEELLKKEYNIDVEFSATPKQ